jgi:transcriptional regulator GlxA family with amidase domain
VRRDHGSALANRLARLCVVPPWREGGQAQFIDSPVPESTTATTSETRQWALGQLYRPITLAELARHARMNVRTFSRRFRAEVGMTPGQWLARQRVEHARRQLETTDLPMARVAAEAGFGTAASLRQHLTGVIGVRRRRTGRRFTPRCRRPARRDTHPTPRFCRRPRVTQGDKRASTVPGAPRSGAHRR